MEARNSNCVLTEPNGSKMMPTATLFSLAMSVAPVVDSLSQVTGHR